MKIVIFGLARSGTTALFYKLKNSLPANTVCLFEPHHFDPKSIRTNIFRDVFRKANVLAKVLPFRPNDPADADSFAGFEKQILIVRDPRDRLISRLLYGVYHSDSYCQPDRARTFVAALKNKEADPRSVSMIALLQAFSMLNGEEFSLEQWAKQYREHSVAKPISFHEEHSHLFLMRYEDLIDARLKDLENYLGVRLAGDATVPSKLSRVGRTKSYGAWKDWFTTEDVANLQPILQPYLDRYYQESEWRLNSAPAVNAEHGSRYIERIINDRRATMNLPPLNYD